MTRRVLLVEDESLLVMVLEDLLPQLDCEMAGTADSVASALAAVDHLDIDLVMLDVNLGGTPSFPVADALVERGIPFLFATGYGVMGLPDRYADAIVLQKPYGKKQLQAALAKLPLHERSKP